MELEEKSVETEEVVATEVVEDSAAATVEENSVENDNLEQSVSTETQDSIEAAQSSQEEYVKSEEDKKEEEDESDTKEDDTKEDTSDDDDDEEKKKDVEKNACGSDGKKKKDYELIEKELEETKTAYAALEEKYQALVEFKESVDNEKKDKLIDSFYMLSDEDKKDVIENKSNYSLDEIEAKLSVICVRKKVNFDLDDTSKSEEKVEDSVKDVITYTVNETDTSTPAWIAALKQTRDSK